MHQLGAHAELLSLPKIYRYVFADWWQKAPAPKIFQVAKKQGSLHFRWNCLEDYGRETQESAAAIKTKPAQPWKAHLDGGKMNYDHRLLCSV